LRSQSSWISRSVEGFEKHIAERLAAILLKDRRQLTLEHLKVVDVHSAFRRKDIWRLFVAAGVRIFLQEHIDETSSMFQETITQDPDEWFGIVQHYRQLRLSISTLRARYRIHSRVERHCGRRPSRRASRCGASGTQCTLNAF
jgi:hypothetical protein